MVKHLLHKLTLLEQTHPKFDRLSLVQNIKQQILVLNIDQHLLPLIHRHTSSVPLPSPLPVSSTANPGLTDLDAALYGAVAAVVSTPEYLDLQKELLHNVQDAVEQLIEDIQHMDDSTRPSRVVGSPWDRLQQNTESQFPFKSDENNSNQQPAQPQPNSNSKSTTTDNKGNDKSPDEDDDNDDDDDLDRFSQFSFNTLPPYEKIPSICQDMKRENEDPIRQSAYTAIMEFSPGDLLHSECWQTLQASITAALDDPLLELRASYFGLLWRLYRDAAPGQTGELYLCLLQH